ncbi:tRNA (guanine(9)-N1)-methyltransferase-like [Dendrobium catenatum]|uniref:tRNA (guanine(9)-N1)-methyltransferase-like n=1 Tax=Dendrobium catenatum TaxID=906689 RepID=UPI0010A05D8E|nr:tRNA (guanine(9)-N1)-methyltransferase-like [Dendrobium catenatum]
MAWEAIETALEELDTNRIYIMGELVDRNRWLGITMKKANEQGIQSAKLPIGNYIKLASSQLNHCILQNEEKLFQ